MPFRAKLRPLYHRNHKVLETISGITKVGNDVLEDRTVGGRLHTSFFITKELLGNALLALRALGKNSAKLLRARKIRIGNSGDVATGVERQFKGTRLFV